MGCRRFLEGSHGDRAHVHDGAGHRGLHHLKGHYLACKAASDAAEQARLAAEQQAAQKAANQLPAVDEWWKQYTSCTKLKKNPNGHPTGPFSRDNPAEAAIYDWFADGTGNNGDGEGDGLACE